MKDKSLKNKSRTKKINNLVELKFKDRNTKSVLDGSAPNSNRISQYLGNMFLMSALETSLVNVAQELYTKEVSFLSSDQQKNLLPDELTELLLSQ
ncbi:MAG: hypothetical protein SFT91_05595 [Rickettsiaceae bacterium]|nr:hypothetical protein [Rickettsiaceae bacterium]